MPPRHHLLLLLLLHWPPAVMAAGLGKASAGTRRHV